MILELDQEFPMQTSLVFSWMSMDSLSQLLRWDLMKPSIFGRSWPLIMVGLMRESNAPLMYLWAEPWIAEMLHLPKMSSIDWGYPGTSPFASFTRIYLFSSGSIETIVGQPSKWDLKKLPYLCCHKDGTINQNYVKNTKWSVIDQENAIA